MKQTVRQDLAKYVSNVSVFLIALGCIFFLLGVVGVLLQSDLFTAFTLLILGALLLFFPFRSRKRVSAFLASMEQSGHLSALLNDFSSSQSMVGGKVRVGREYIFGRKQGIPIAYSQMRKVYQYVHKTNFVENGRELRCVLDNGKTVTLCQLKLRGKSDEDVAKIMGYIHYRNPGVHLGYK